MSQKKNNLQLLFEWCQNCTRDYPNVSLKNWNKSLEDGIVFLAILHYHKPELVPDIHELKPGENGDDNLRRAWDLAYTHFGVEKFLEVEDMHPSDTKANQTYVIELHKMLSKARREARESNVEREVEQLLKQTPVPPVESKQPSPSNNVTAPSAEVLPLETSQHSQTPNVHEVSPIGKISIHTRKAEEPKELQAEVINDQHVKQPKDSDSQSPSDNNNVEKPTIQTTPESPISVNNDPVQVTEEPPVKVPQQQEPQQQEPPIIEQPPPQQKEADEPMKKSKVVTEKPNAEQPKHQQGGIPKILLLLAILYVIYAIYFVFK